MTSRQVDVVLGLLLAASVTTGVASWLVSTSVARPVVMLHAVFGLTILLLAPLKVRGSVRTGLRRHRATRLLSIAYGLMVVAAVGLGAAHALGLWFGVGYWSALWTHLLFGFVAVPLTAWHVLSRPARPNVTDLNRRALLTSAAVTAAAAGLLGVQEVAARRLGLAGASRAGTGSHEVASFDPKAMPVVSWIDDQIPPLEVDSWPLRIFGQSVDLDDIAPLTVPMRAILDCTGGWFSEQEWHVVSLADIVAAYTTSVPDSTRSVMVRSATGYSRLFPLSAAASLYLATGYGDQALRAGHGAPLRVVAPGRRGPWWIKWVTEIELSSRPGWAQLPLPVD